MKHLMCLVVAMAATSNASAEGGLTAKSLFFGTDGSVMSVATAPPATTPLATVANAANKAASNPTRVAAAKKPINLGAGYFIRLKNDDGSVKDVLASRAFKSGERFQLGVKVNRPTYIYIYNQAPDGNVVQLYPQPGQSNFVDAMGVVFFPAKGSFEFDSNPGAEQLSVYLSPRPIDDIAKRMTWAKPDLVSDPGRSEGSADGACEATAGQRQGGTPTALAMADTSASVLAPKGIDYKSQDACTVAPKLASKAIVFSDDPSPSAGGQVASYVVKPQARPSDSLHLQLKLVHR